MRVIKHLYQRLTRGFADPEWYELRTHAARYILPRLKHYKAHSHGYKYTLPIAENVLQLSFDEERAQIAAWATALDDMIYAMEYLAYERDPNPDEDRVQRGCELLGIHFMGLWD